MQFYGWYHLLRPFDFFISYHVGYSESCDGLILRLRIGWYFRLMQLALSDISFFGVCFVLFGWCVFARYVFGAIYTLCALRRFDCFYLRSFRAKQMNLSQASRYIGIAPFSFRRFSMDQGFHPFSVFLSGYTRFTERLAALRSEFFFEPFLGSPLSYHKEISLSIVILRFWSFFWDFLRRLCLISV